MTNYTNFKSKYLGKKVDEDGVAGVQCVDLAKLYIEEVHGEKWRPMGGNGGAVEGYRLYPNSLITEKGNWKRITNDTSNPNQFPEQGDLIIFDATSGNKWGHIAVYDRKLNVNGFISLDQNVGSGEIKEVKHSFTASGGFGKVLGWLHNTADSNEEPMEPTEIEKLRKGFNVLTKVVADNGRKTIDLTGTLQAVELVANSTSNKAATNQTELRENRSDISILDTKVVELGKAINPGFKEKSEKMKVFLGLMNKTAPVLAAGFGFVGLTVDGIQSTIAAILAVISGIGAVYLENDKTKYKQKELMDIRLNK